MQYYTLDDQMKNIPMQFFFLQVLETKHDNSRKILERFFYRTLNFNPCKKNHKWKEGKLFKTSFDWSKRFNIKTYKFILKETL